MTYRSRFAAMVVTGAAVIAGAHVIDAAPVGVFYDDAHYAILGKALANGAGYRYINLPGMPIGTHFPPGYPALLSVLWRIAPAFPENVALFKAANAVLLGVVALSAYVMARSVLELGRLTAAFVALAGTVTVPALLLSNNVISEMMFLALLLPLLMLAEDWCRHPGFRRAALLGAAAGVISLVRTHGIVLIPAMAIVYALSRRPREAGIVVAAGAMALAPWLLWVNHYDSLIPLSVRGQYGSYAAWLVEGVRSGGLRLIGESLGANLGTSAAILARSFSPAPHSLLDAVAVVAVLTLCVAGALEFARVAKVTLIFVIQYLAITLLWPFSPLRFIWGIWPLTVMLMVCGARYLWRFRETRARTPMRAVAAVASVIVVLGAANFNVRGYANAWWASVSQSIGPRILPRLLWVASHTHSSEVVATGDEGSVYLYTTRQAVPLTAFTAAQYIEARSPQEEASAMAAIIRDFSPAYVMPWTVPTQQAASLLTGTNPPQLVQVDTFPGGRVYQPVDVVP